MGVPARNRGRRQPAVHRNASWRCLQRVDLSQHNYTAFLNLLALPLIPLFGVIRTFNIVFIAMTVLTALCGYTLARLAFPTTRLEAFGAGLAFAWAPALIARSTGHLTSWPQPHWRRSPGA